MDLKTVLEVASESDVAELRNVSVQALRNERSRGLGPPFQKIGNKVFYPLKPLRAHLAATTVTPSRTQTMVTASKPRRARARS